MYYIYLYVIMKKGINRYTIFCKIILLSNKFIEQLYNRPTLKIINGMKIHSIIY